MADLTADELLNLALIGILHGDYGQRIVARQHYHIDVDPDGSWPDSRYRSDHLESCPEATATAATGEDHAVNTHNVAIIHMTVTCPHVGSAPAQLGTYGHLAWLLDEMHQIGQYLKPYEENDHV